MSSSSDFSMSTGPAAAGRDLRAIVAHSHPGGRYPGKEIPPSWFKAALPRVDVPTALPAPGDQARIVEAVRQMSAAVRDAATAALMEEVEPVLVGGDHSLAMGTLAAVTARQPRTAVIWIDAHADFNTPDTSPSGNPHGMPLAVACGLGDARLTSLFENFVHPSDVVLIGARDIDPGEAELLNRHGIWHVGVAELRAMGVPALVAAIHERFDSLPVHLSFDFDSITAEHFSATGTPVAEGLLPEEAEALLSGLARTKLAFCSSDWVEFAADHPEAEACAKTARRMFEAFHGARRLQATA